LGNPAARKGDKHTCPVATPVPHVGGPISGPCCTSVLIGGMPAARVGDQCDCHGIPDVILTGSSGVFIGGRSAARMGDITTHMGVITTGCASVLIGEIGGNGTPANFVMPSEAEKVRIINETIQACILLLQKKLNLLKKNDPKTLEEFEVWFGIGDEGAKQIIIHRIDRALNLFDSLNEQDFVVVQDEFLRRKTYAMVHPEDNKHIILLGDKFWSAADRNEISRINVLLHEISHFYDIGNTHDFSYGIKLCQNLAKKKPAKALYNADTFAFFIEA
jgi:uncharacterized Zn-binding protein involved in type VI secretion